MSESEMAKINSEIRMADMRTACFMSWGIMLLIYAFSIQNPVLQACMMLLSMIPMLLVVWARMPRCFP